MPRIVAVIGASNNRDKFGNKALRAFERQGYTVIPINPNETEVEGHKAYATVLDVPGAIDMATVYVPPDTGLVVMDQLAQKGVPEVWLNPGADSVEVVARAHALGLKTIQVVQHHRDWGEPGAVLNPRQPARRSALWINPRRRVPQDAVPNVLTTRRAAAYTLANNTSNHPRTAEPPDTTPLR